MIYPNLKRRLSGVTTSLLRLIPVLREAGCRVAALGPGIPPDVARLRWRDLPRLWKRPPERAWRVWHARRNVEMALGLVLRDILRMPIRIVFTSASQREHSWTTRFFLRRMDRVIATSAKTQAYLSVPATVVIHGIDLARFHPAEDKAAAKAAVGLDAAHLHVGCFGRIRHMKGTGRFVDSLIPLLGERPDWRAVIAGRATAQHREFLDRLSRQVREAGLGDRFLFVGEHSDIERWYRALDLFAAPQRWEGFGLTPLEAMATALPVVATDVGAFAEFVEDGVTGALVPNSDEGDPFGAALRRYMDDEMRRREAGANGRRRVEAGFSLEREAAALAAIYDDMAPRLPVSGRAAA